MRLSPFHLELAKRVAQGQPNRDIMKDIQVSGSRLSVLKANPLFAREVERFRAQEQDKYTKAIEVFADKAEDVAKEITNMATSPLTPHNIRLQAGVIVLDRLAQVEGHVGNTQSGEDEVTFEQILRVTKRGNGQSGISHTDTGDMSSAIQDLEQDLLPEPDDTDIFELSDYHHIGASEASAN